MKNEFVRTTSMGVEDRSDGLGVDVAEVLREDISQTEPVDA